MARIAVKTYSFKVPGDAVKARIYAKAGAVNPTYADAYVELAVSGTPDVNNQIPMTYTLPGALNILTNGSFTLGASALDAAGNESDIGAFANYPFDFTAPAAPTNGVIS